MRTICICLALRIGLVACLATSIFAEDLTLRRAAIADLPDWQKAGYRGTGVLPTSADIGATLDATSYGVIAGDAGDDSAALQLAIDAARGRAGAGHNNLTLLRLPAGRILVSRQLRVDASFLVIRGAGSDATTGTTLVFRPDTTTRYDKLTSDGSRPDLEAMDIGSASGGWIWPGRGLLRVENRDVHSA